MNINLMSANITANGASCSADLLTDLKSGYLLGANPRKQFIAQFAGIFMGTVVTVLSFRLLVPNASVLGGDQFPGAGHADVARGGDRALARALGPRADQAPVHPRAAPSWASCSPCCRCCSPSRST